MYYSREKPIKFQQYQRLNIIKKELFQTEGELTDVWLCNDVHYSAQALVLIKPKWFHPIWTVW